MKYDQELLKIFTDLGLPKFRLKQLLSAIFSAGALNYNEITVFSDTLKNKLASSLPILSLVPVRHLVSVDGHTEKVAFRLVDGPLIESVLMHYRDGRNSICISSQAGCQMGCFFCATGTLKFSRNLTAEEITDQVLYFQSRLLKKNQTVSNIVFMGMGEPFMNYDQVIRAIQILNHPDYFNFASRRITVSTCGMVDGIKKLTNEKFQVNLAISLHSAVQKTREKLMPVAKAYPLEDLLQVVGQYCQKTRRRVSFEYLLLKGVNDSANDALALAKICRNKLIHVNLIPYNETNIHDLQDSTKDTVQNFQKILQNEGVNVTVRVTMGQDIAAACGQLANKLIS